MEKQKLGFFTRTILRLKQRIRRNKRAFIIYSVLRLLVLLSMVGAILRQDYESVATCVLVLVLFLLPALVEDLFHAEVPQTFQIIIYCEIFATEILGEVGQFYTHVHGWDTIMHTLSGFVAAAVGFSLVDLLNRGSKGVQLSPLFVAIMGFCFSMTIGVLWEFFECFADLYVGADMQKDTIVQAFNIYSIADPGTIDRLRGITETVITTASGERYTIPGGYLDIGLLDTMKDLFVNFIGAVTFSLFGYFYLKKHPNEPIKSGLIIRPVEESI